MGHGLNSQIMAHCCFFGELFYLTGRGLMLSTPNTMPRSQLFL